MQKTLVILKPSGVPHLHEAMKAIQALDLIVVDYQELTLTEEQIRQHYAKYVEKPFFPEMVKMMSHSVIPILVEGEDAVQRIREEFMPIFREAHKKDQTDNACHCSDSKEDPAEECERFFGSEGIVASWRHAHPNQTHSAE